VRRDVVADAPHLSPYSHRGALSTCTGNPFADVTCFCRAIRIAPKDLLKNRFRRQDEATRFSISIQTDWHTWDRVSCSSREAMLPKATASWTSPFECPDHRVRPTRGRHCTTSQPVASTVHARNLDRWPERHLRRSIPRPVTSCVPSAIPDDHCETRGDDAAFHKPSTSVHARWDDGFDVRGRRAGTNRWRKQWHSQQRCPWLQDILRPIRHVQHGANPSCVGHAVRCNACRYR